MTEAERQTRAGPRLALIVARARNGVIGRDGGLPWRLKSDLQAFKRLTMGKPILMGRKTWDSLPRLLPGRPHFVLSRDPDLRADGAEVFDDFEEMLAQAGEAAIELGADEVMVIGGEAIYRLALERADRIYLTEVEAEVDGDARFPAIDPQDWREIEAVRHEADKDNEHAFTLRVLDRAPS